MRKREEMADPRSTWNRARDDERVFILLERDSATPGCIRVWCALRVMLGLNLPGDQQIVEAQTLADEIERGYGR